MRVRFTKMQGAGNDFVVLDATREPFALTRRSKAVCRPPLRHRRRPDPGRRAGRAGRESTSATASSTASGDEVEQCGNGARCFVRFVRERGSDRQETRSRRHHERPCRAALAGRRPRQRRHGRARLRPGARAVRRRRAAPACATAACALWPIELGDGRSVDVAVVSMGNPHAVQIVADVDAAPVAAAGAADRAPSRASRSGVNAGFCRSSSATQCGCACTSAAPAKRWRAAPAPAPRSWPASASACSRRRSRSRRAAAGSRSNGRRRADAGADDRAGGNRVRRRDRALRGTK